MARIPWLRCGKAIWNSYWKSRRTDSRRISGLARTRSDRLMFSRPGVLLRIEGMAVFVLSLFLYREMGPPWWRFFLLFLFPDLFMAGYLASVRAGAQLYNLVHTYVLPLALAGAALHEHRFGLLSFALIWIAHIGADRAL